ncbi:hypothetical protein [Metapseudomonas otitidis]|uniref:hypothetical protein n=1 Tax=Metapseudomonas otitidis TaxID=319939 RepID=UPI001AAF25BC|nr:hypothetical protein [Pseudomonas otitidis]MBO2926643.1 hypothetical protein [Pseudomonas otitidis]
MRYRKLDADGDYTFGRSQQDFLVNTPETVGQAVMTRLRLWLGEWFINTADGLPWKSQVLGEHTRATYDAAIKNRILQTQGVRQIDSYESSFDGETRRLSVRATITTQYGQTSITGTL